MTQNKKTNIQTRKVATKLYAAIIERKLSLAGLTNEKTGANYYICLDSQDQNFVKAIVNCTLRNKAYIEHLLPQYLIKSLPAGARSLQHILHISIAQLLYLNVSNYAAINIAVDLAKYDSRTKRFAKLVNAILREISRDIEKNNIQNKLQLDPLQTVPAWFKTLLINDYGEEKAKQIINAQTNHQSIDLTVKNDVNFWAAKLNAKITCGNNIRLPSDYKSDITKLEGYTTGQWWVQDCAASLPAMFIGEDKNIKIADLCAAPGGKTAQLCNIYKDVTAFELNSNRFARLKDNLNRLDLSPKVILSDFSLSALKNEFDAVLLDAPCSSFGTIRKNPDILWIKNFEDIKKASEFQYTLLKHAINCTKINGHILFSNCSLAKLEGEKLIQSLLNNEKNIELVPIQANEKFLQKNSSLIQFITKEGFFRITPDDFTKITNNVGAMDGFFIAKLKKLS